MLEGAGRVEWSSAVIHPVVKLLLEVCQAAARKAGATASVILAFIEHGQEKLAREGVMQDGGEETHVNGAVCELHGALVALLTQLERCGEAHPSISLPLDSGGAARGKGRAGAHCAPQPRARQQQQPCCLDGKALATYDECDVCLAAHLYVRRCGSENVSRVPR